jgi:DNA-binding PadR family transcriptional regulator
MSLRYALLALLSSRAMTGYDVSKHFGQSVAHVWHAPDSQIYPELRRMSVEGLLEVRTVKWGARGEKKEYHVTDAGFEAFRAWMNTPIEARRQRDPAFLKAAYLEWADPESARAEMWAQISFHQSLLELLEHTRETLRDRTHPTLVRRLEHYPPAEHDRIVAWKVFAYDGLIAQARLQLEWARRGLALVDTFEAAGATPLEDPRRPEESGVH